MDKLLLKNLISANFKRSSELDGTICKGEKIKVFTVNGEQTKCLIWNSSNNSGFDKKDACRQIAEQILDDGDSFTEAVTFQGSLSMDFNEIMFEIKEK